jgi:hypothetical protein
MAYGPSLSAVSERRANRKSTVVNRRFIMLCDVLNLRQQGSSHPFSDADRVRRSSKSRKLLRKEWFVDVSLRGYCTVKLFAVVVIPPALVTAIGPDVAPAGTVASMK